MQRSEAATRARARPRRRGPAPWRLVAVGAICIASAVGVLLAPGRPTGNNLADPAWEALLGVAVPLAASRARRWSLLVLTTVTALVADSTREIAVAMATLVAAVALAVLDRRDRIVGAAIGAAAVQVLVRLPDLGFQGASALATAVAVTPVLVSGLRNTRRRWRRPITGLAVALALGLLLLSAAVAVGALIGRAAVDDGIAAARSGLDAIAAGDQAAAEVHLRDAANDLERAAALIDNPLARLARGVPVVAQHQRSLGVGVRSAHDLAGSAADAAVAVEIDGLRPVDGRLDLDAVRDAETALARSVASLDAARADLSRLGSGWVVDQVASRIDELASEVDDALPQARTALDGARVAPSMLGGDGPRNWLVLFMTPAETRLLGGFVGNWALIEADDGAIRLLDAGPVHEVNNGPGADQRDISEPQEFLDRYARYTPDAYFQNVTASPHFPSSAQVAASFFSQSMLTDVDGVIAVDPFALGGLVDLVGGIELPGIEGRVDGDALSQLLVVDVYERPEAEQGGIYQAAVDTTFGAMTSGQLPGPARLADVMSPYVRQGRLLAWSPDAAEQELLGTLGLDGALPPADGRDLLLVGIANNNPSKIDPYLERDVGYAIRYEPTGGGAVAEATLTLRNTATLDLPEVVIGNAHDLPPGTARTYVTLYSPLVLREMRLDGEIVPVAAQAEQGYRAYSLLVDVPAGGEVRLEWDLQGTLAPGGYRLHHRVQPTVVPAEVSIVATTSGAPWELAPDAPRPRGIEVDGSRATIVGTADETVDVQLGVGP